jgi:DNA-binding NtrC family response regulator
MIAKLSAEMQLGSAPEAHPELFNELMNYEWPGNIRELRNVIERGLMLSQGKKIELSAMSLSVRPLDWSFTVKFPEQKGLSALSDELCCALCAEALRRTSGNRSEAAQLLGISRDSLYRYMKKWSAIFGQSSRK